jgi:HlyD family secretion protein
MSNNRAFSVWKWILLLGAIALAGWGVWFFFSGQEPEGQYQIAKITRGDLTQGVTATGTLNPVVNVQVGSQISGRIGRLYVDFNATVTSNQIIAEIDSSTYKANMQRAEADLASALAGLELAQVEARRAGELFTNNLISASDHDTAIASLHQAEATAQIRRAALSSAGVDLSRCTIYSPVDGVVISRNVDVGQTVAASLSAPVLFQIASDLTRMQIDANVAEADVGGVKVDQEVEFTVDAFPYRTFPGVVKQVRNAPTTVQNVVTYDSVIEVNNTDLKLKPGMTANVSIIVEQRENVLKIPNAALRFRPPENTVLLTNALARAGGDGSNRTNRDLAGVEPGRRRGPGGGGGRGGRGGGERRSSQTVYVLPGGDAQTNASHVKLKPVRIRLGITDGIATEVLDGLSENDVVVTGSTAPVVPTAAGAQNPFGGGGPPGQRGFRRF